MLTPIVCFTCGMPIGELAVYYRAERAARYAIVLGGTEARGVVPHNAPLTTLSIDMTDWFEKQHVDLDCCRTHLTTAKVFEDHY